jgi:hypothetical protein
MKEIITADGLHRWTIEPSIGYYTFTLYEMMGGRWVQLGPPEVWSSCAAIELLEELEG